MPIDLISCLSLPPATISSVPICEFADANKELAKLDMEQYASCCGKSICGGCEYSFCKSGNEAKCPFCKADLRGKTDLDRVEELKKRMEVNDAGAIYMLAQHYCNGEKGLLQDRAKAIELYTRAADLGSSQAHFHLGNIYDEDGDLKKAKIHLEAAAMAGDNGARYNIGLKECNSGNMERAVNHWTISASAGNYYAMHNLLVVLKRGVVSRDSVDSTLVVYNKSCVEMRSEARDAWIHAMAEELEHLIS
jgi:TPR repeat protein